MSHRNLRRFFIVLKTYSTPNDIICLQEVGLLVGSFGGIIRREALGKFWIYDLSQGEYWCCHYSRVWSFIDQKRWFGQGLL